MKGFADLHNHQFAYLSFGDMAFYGRCLRFHRARGRLRIERERRLCLCCWPDILPFARGTLANPCRTASALALALRTVASES